VKNITDKLYYSHCSSPLTEYATIQLAHPQHAAGMQSISETDAAATVANKVTLCTHCNES